MDVPHSAIEAIENEVQDLPAALARLRDALSLAEYGQLLLSLPDEQLPVLSSLLPEMESEEVQLRWTGNKGLVLLQQSCEFVQLVADTFERETGRPLRDVDVLDFGCGWGRLLRLLSYFNDPSRNHGCDAWTVSLGHARKSHVDRLATLALSDVMPTTLPYPPESFDLIYAFSVFTHLSEECATTCLSAIRGALRPGGVVIITTRPLEYWLRSTDLADDVTVRLLREHDRRGFAFHQIEGHYGDTTISAAFLRTLLPVWQVSAMATASQQVPIVLRPAP